MTRVLDDNSHTMSHPDRPAGDIQPHHGWLDRLRKAGLGRFETVGFPTTAMEEWRYTNVAPIAQTAFVSPEFDITPAVTAAASRHSLGLESAIEVVLINGRFSAELSRITDLPDGLRIATLGSLIQSDPTLIEHHLGRYADIDASPFVALNTANIKDGLVIQVARETTIDRPIHILCISSTGRAASISHPRLLVVLEELAQAGIVESYVGATDEACFTNAVTEISAAADARLDHCKLQHESLEAFHIATMQTQLARGSSFISHSVSLGSRLARNDLNVILNGEYAEATLNGLVNISGNQVVDNHTLMRHEKPNCASHELYKHVIGGKATGVFKGQIFVQQDAQKTDSKQTSKSLLLTDDAIMHSQPALEIYADDVKCTHGSTTGPLDEDMVFYLRSRGVEVEQARHLLTYAFLADITRRMRVEPIRRRIEDLMAAEHGLPQDLRITDLGRHDEKSR